MFKIIAAAGPTALLFCGVLSALLVGYLCNARGRWLFAVAALAVPLTFVGILLHDLLDLDAGLSSFASTILVISTTTGVGAGLLASLFANK